MQRPSAVLDISASELQEIVEELSALPAEQQEVRLIAMGRLVRSRQNICDFPLKNATQSNKGEVTV
jgi:hypothetical protein